MKTTMILSAALLISAASFAQNTTANQHGASVSSTAKSATEVSGKGATVSEAASIQGQAHMNTEGAQKLSRKALREKRRAEKELARKSRETKAEVKESITETTEAANNEHGVLVSSTAKAEAEAGNKGVTVREVASSKSDVSVNTEAAGKAKTKLTSETGELNADLKDKAGSVKAEVKKSAENANNDHGVTVSSTAKASIEGEQKGSVVSEAAKVNSKSNTTKVRSATKVKASRPAVKTNVQSGVRVGIK